jgi:hypothetical protein
MAQLQVSPFTQEARELFQLMPELQQLTVEDSKEPPEPASEQLLSKLRASFGALLEKNAHLQKEIEAYEAETHLMESKLKAKLQEARAALHSVKERTQAQETPHKAAMTILEKQVAMVEGERRAILDEIRILKVEQQKLQYNDAPLREAVKYGLNYLEYWDHLCSAVNMAHAKFKP